MPEEYKKQMIYQSKVKTSKHLPNIWGEAEDIKLR